MKHNFTVKQDTPLSEALKSELPRLKRSREKSLISAREVKVNGTRVSADIQLTAGDAVDVFVPESYLDDLTVKIIYNDDNIIIADKPPRTESETDLPALLRGYGTLLPVHRLDTNTTGLMILAKSEPVRDSLIGAFKSRSIEKTYIASVCGAFKQKAGILKCWLVKSRNGTVAAHDKPAPGGMEAVTGYEVTGFADGISTIKLMPKTGRTHQLRVQLAHFGHPILGDGKYGDFEKNRRYGVTSQQLRAVALRLDGLTPPIEHLNGKIFKTEEYHG